MLNLDPSTPDMSSHSAHVEYSEVTYMSQMNLMSFDQSMPEDHVLGLNQWDIMDSSMPDMSSNLAHIEYSEVADMSQINLEHYSATMDFQESHEAVESMVMNNSVEPTEGTTFEVPELQVPDDLYQWDGKEFDEQNQMLYDVPEVDVEVNIAERLAATMEPTEATYPAEATDMLNVDQSVSDNSVHVHYSEVAAFEKGQGQQGCAADYEEQLYWLSRMELEDTCYEMLEPNEAFQLAP